MARALAQRPLDGIDSWSLGARERCPPRGSPPFFIWELLNRAYDTTWCRLIYLSAVYFWRFEDVDSQPPFCRETSCAMRDGEAVQFRHRLFEVCSGIHKTYSGCMYVPVPIRITKQRKAPLEIVRFGGMFRFLQLLQQRKSEFGGYPCPDFRRFYRSF